MGGMRGTNSSSPYQSTSTTPLSTTSTLNAMPRDEQNRFWARGIYQQRTITRPTNSVFPRSRQSTRHYPRPYPTPEQIIERLDGDGDDWYHLPSQDLHQRDFVWTTAMQTARRMTQRMKRFGNRDQVLERLLEEGTFNRRDPDYRNASEEYAMMYSAAIGQRLL